MFSPTPSKDGLEVFYRPQPITHQRQAYQACYCLDKVAPEWTPEHRPTGTHRNLMWISAELCDNVKRDIAVCKENAHLDRTTALDDATSSLHIDIWRIDVAGV